MRVNVIFSYWLLRFNIFLLREMRSSWLRYCKWIGRLLVQTRLVVRPGLDTISCIETSGKLQVKNRWTAVITTGRVRLSSWWWPKVGCGTAKKNYSKKTVFNWPVQTFRKTCISAWENEKFNNGLKWVNCFWRRPFSYRNQSTDLLRKSMEWFLYDNGLRHERVNQTSQFLQT